MFEHNPGIDLAEHEDHIHSVVTPACWKTWYYMNHLHLTSFHQGAHKQIYKTTNQMLGTPNLKDLS